jgi:hypothetical protein
MAERKCKNWIESFLQWTVQSEAPDSYLRFAAYFTLSSALRRHIKVGNEYLGGWECYPNMYICYVGPAGVVKKSTSIGKAEELLENLSQLPMQTGSATTPIIIKKLQDSPDSSLIISVDELGVLVEKAGTSIYSILIRLFDGKRRIEDETIMRGLVLAENPSCNFFAGTTPEWISENFSTGVLGGGFGSRTLFIHESEPRHFRLIHKGHNTHIDFVQLKANLVEDLTYISESIHGDFQMDEETYMWFDKWYVKSVENPDVNERKIKGYVQRRPAYVMKIAMLEKIAVSDELILTIPDLENAIRVLKNIEHKIANTFRAVGRNKYVPDMDGIEAFIRDSGKVEQSALFAEFNAVAEPAMFKQLIEALILMDRIQLSIDTTTHKNYFSVIPKKLQIAK